MSRHVLVSHLRMSSCTQGQPTDSIAISISFGKQSYKLSAIGKCSTTLYIYTVLPRRYPKTWARGLGAGTPQIQQQGFYRVFDRRTFDLSWATQKPTCVPKSSSGPVKE